MGRQEDVQETRQVKDAAQEKRMGVEPILCPGGALGLRPTVCWKGKGIILTYAGVYQCIPVLELANTSRYGREGARPVDYSTSVLQQQSKRSGSSGRSYQHLHSLLAEVA